MKRRPKMNKIPVTFPIKYLYERRNQLFSEVKKLKWVLEKHGESEYATDYTLSSMESELAQFDAAIETLKMGDKYMFAKYNAMSMAASRQALGYPMTSDMIKDIYEASLKDLQRPNIIDEVAEEYDKIVK